MDIHNKMADIRNSGSGLLDNKRESGDFVFDNDVHLTDTLVEMVQGGLTIRGMSYADG
jgi:hypothetical protein